MLLDLAEDKLHSINKALKKKCMTKKSYLCSTQKWMKNKGENYYRKCQKMKSKILKKSTWYLEPLNYWENMKICLETQEEISKILFMVLRIQN